MPQRWRFYVYELAHPDGRIAYVGKGSGRRLAVQARRTGLAGAEVCRFMREDDAYAHERERIAALAPDLNRHPGGNGSRATQQAPRKFKWETEIERVGSRRYVARYLVSRCLHMLDPSKIDAIRSVADGPRA
mgnify:CR=1 FL=1